MITWVSKSETIEVNPLNSGEIEVNFYDLYDDEDGSQVLYSGRDILSKIEAVSLAKFLMNSQKSEG